MDNATYDLLFAIPILALSMVILLEDNGKKLCAQQQKLKTLSIHALTTLLWRILNMVDHGLGQVANTFNKLIGPRCKQGNTSEANKLLNVMVESGVKPDTFIYNILLNGYFKEGHFDEVSRILKFMQKDVLLFDLYNIIIKCSSESDYEKQNLSPADLEMSPSTTATPTDPTGVNPEFGSDDSILRAPKSPRSDVWNFFEKIDVTNDKHGPTRSGPGLGSGSGFSRAKLGFSDRMDRPTYSTLMDGYCLIGEMHEGLKYFDLMLEKAFTIMIDWMFRVGRTQVAKNLFCDMLAKEFVLNIVTYTFFVMQGLMNEGMLNEVDDLFFSIEKYGCTSDSNMLNVVVRILLKRGEMRKAKEFLYKIKS
ncbi:protein Rf1, mitochondrial-like [Asparagus officinalis]|uniref:protein Rf1, mitochondrial-like n=1 Tax=Asparagus officinalis TaxID=4686 RepID=UPI00098E0DE5|nr:protein Rf1, mitochondrial-like [Asparagus officinalis]